MEILTPVDWTFLTVMTGFFGACVGSFLNVCIYRIPREISIVAPRSHCPACGHLIPWYLNIPVVSYLFLGGRCRFCRAPISFRYVLVELLTALAFLFVWLRFIPFGEFRPLGLEPLADGRLLPVYWLMSAGLILGTFIDLEHMILPDRCTLGGIAAGLILSGLLPAMHGAEGPLASLQASLLGAAVGWGSLWLVAKIGAWVFRKEAMGFGDVKLLGAIGAFLGWRAVLFTIVISSLLGSIAGLALILSGQGKLQSRIPYGPYLALAAWIWILWGPALWNLYAALLTVPAGT